MYLQGTNRAHDDLYLKKMIAGLYRFMEPFSVFKSSGGERFICVKRFMCIQEPVLLGGMLKMLFSVEMDFIA